MKLYDCLFKPHRYKLPNGKVVEEKFTRLPLILLVILFCTVVSVRVTGFNFETLLSGGSRFFSSLISRNPPELGRRLFL